MHELKASPREVFGKRLKDYRRKLGRLPAIFYGRRERATPLFVEAKEFKKVWNAVGESQLVTLQMEGGDRDVLIHSVAADPLTDEPVHVDFYAVDKTQKVTVRVQLEFSGVAPAVKELGGTLVKVVHDLEVEAFAQSIPQKIAVDLSRLADLESQITVKDLNLPPAVRVLNDPEEVVAAVTVVEEEVESVASSDLSAIEIEKKGKKEEPAEAPATEARE